MICVGRIQPTLIPTKLTSQFTLYCTQYYKEKSKETNTEYNLTIQGVLRVASYLLSIYRDPNLIVIEKYS